VSEKLPRLTAKELIRVLERKGWEFTVAAAATTSTFTRNPTDSQRTGRSTAVDRDTSALLKDAEISRDELRRML
jgi:hypothetical protein